MPLMFFSDVIPSASVEDQVMGRTAQMRPELPVQFLMTKTFPVNMKTT